MSSDDVSSQHGRVKAIFWTLQGVPGPIGAAIATFIAEKTESVVVIVGIGIFTLILALVGLVTPLAQAHPEKTTAEPEKKLSRFCNDKIRRVYHRVGAVFGLK